MTTSEVSQEGWQSNKHSDRQESRSVADTQVVESGEEETGRLFFWRKAEELGVELNDFVAPAVS